MASPGGNVVLDDVLEAERNAAKGWKEGFLDGSGEFWIGHFVQSIEVFGGFDAHDGVLEVAH